MSADKYNTELGYEDEWRFGEWLDGQSKKAGRDMSRDLEDYDMRGAYKAGMERGRRW